ncbi:restriction endonuclease subunit S [Burkholderia cepacia]|uniref:restriction endonuclease subunit S n=1 Tax=Burkholderia cepacia TaxID=292 RepID=UPI002FE126A0
MARERIEKSLGELYDFRSGLSKAASEFGSGYPFLTFKDVFYNTFVPDELGDLVNSTEAERNVGNIRRGDVFLTRTSETMEELGMSCVALKDIPLATFNGFTKRLRPKADAGIVPEFAGYLFRGPQFRRDVTAMSSLSTRASLNNDMLARLRISLPDVSEQAEIGRTLKSLDDKIEQNRKTRHSLEQLARAVFRAWFVDFEPVKTKVAGRKGFASMPQAIFEALPTRFVDSEVGPVPEGWEVRPIGDVVSIKGGATPSTKNPEYWEGGQHCWATPKDMSRLSCPVLLDTERHITDAGVQCISSGLLPSGAVLMSSRAPVGYLAIAGVSTAINQGFIAMICDGPLPSTYILQWANASMDAIHARASGTTFPEISKKNFRSLPIVVPPPGVIAAFQSLAAPFFELLTATVKDDEALAATRAYLQPRLLSGSVSVEARND